MALVGLTECIQTATGHVIPSGSLLIELNRCMLQNIAALLSLPEITFFVNTTQSIVYIAVGLAFSSGSPESEMRELDMSSGWRRSIKGVLPLVYYICCFIFVQLTVYSTYIYTPEKYTTFAVLVIKTFRLQIHAFFLR